MSTEQPRVIEELTEAYFEQLLARGESEDSARAQAVAAAQMWSGMLRRTQ